MMSGWHFIDAVKQAPGTHPKKQFADAPLGSGFLANGLVVV
jgi:hypothetical protein